MKDLLFLPIDIDLSTLTSIEINNPHPVTKWNGYWDTSFVSDETVERSNLKAVLDQLPFKKITRLTHKIQTVVVPPHLDVNSEMVFEEGEYQHIKDHEPCGYRLVLSGNTNKLSVKTSNGWQLTTLPSVPCCYILNSSAGWHKVEMDDNRSLIYIRGWLDTDRHFQLLERSLEKYKDYAVYR